jgi:hypothetical protein
VEFRGHVLRICKLAFGSQDGSIYLFPYAPGGEYHFGNSSIPSEEEEVSVPFADQESSSVTPKLSLHESGQVHVKAGATVVGPMHCAPLAVLSGEHIATTTISSFAGLPALGHTPRHSGRCPDIVLPAPGPAASGRLAFFRECDATCFSRTMSDHDEARATESGAAALRGRQRDRSTAACSARRRHGSQCSCRLGPFGDCWHRGTIGLPLHRREVAHRALQLTPPLASWRQTLNHWRKRRLK